MRMAAREAKRTSRELRDVAGAVVARVAAEELSVSDRMAISLLGIAHRGVARGIDLQVKGLEENRRRGHVVPEEGEAGRGARATVVRCDRASKARRGRMAPRHLP
jgi:hypothetical protein